MNSIEKHWVNCKKFGNDSEKLDPVEVRRLMNRCFDVLTNSIKRYGGTIDKYIGDASMALFGAPMALEDHAERAVLAALNMRKALRLFNIEIDSFHHFGITLKPIVNYWTNEAVWVNIPP